MVPWTGAIIIIIASLFRRDPRRRFEDFVTVIGYAVYVALGIEVHYLLATRVTRNWDAAFLAADARLGFNPLAFAAAISRHGLFNVFLILAYVLLPAVIGLAWVLEQDRHMRRAVAVGGCLCFLFYFLFPAVGPAHFDWVKQVPFPLNPLNCMPSMHFTWALLIAINARAPRLRLALWVYAGIIGVATVGIGEHYIVDLLAAVPYALVVERVTAVQAFKKRFTRSPSHGSSLFS
jgi:hypothetical protein